VIRRKCARDGRAHFLRADDNTIGKNESRCQQILECKRKIEFWRSKLDVLEKEQTMQIKLARLRIDAASTWRALSPRDKMEKKFILAAMESKELPTILDDFASGNLPPSIRMDKDILLARVARHDFQDKYDDERLFVPPKLRGDKQIMMAIIPKHCAVVECMSNNLRNDDEIFQTVLSNSTLPNYVLQHFSERIQSDRNLMLQLCAHRNGISSLSFVSSELRNDKEFILEAIKVSCSNHTQNSNVSISDVSIRSGKETKISRRKGRSISGSSNNFQILRYVSQRLQDDHDVVLATVKNDGLNLKYASYDLRRDFTIAMTAIEENGEAFRYCLPGEVKDRLLSDRNLVLNHIIKKNAPYHHTILRMCLDRFKTDQEILLEALTFGIDWSLVPSNLQDSREFVKNAVMRNPRLYLNLPEALRKDFEIASIVIKGDFVDNSVLLEATEQCPRLLSDRESMLTIAKCWWTDVLEETLQFSPIGIRGDKKIMLEAIKNTAVAYEFCSEELSTDRDIVLALVKSCPGNLYLIPESFQLDNPDIVIYAIESCVRNDSWSLYEDVCEDLWSNRDVAISWLSKFGDWLHDDFPEEFEEDEEICLTLIKQNWADFENFSVALRNNKEFMLKALAVDARVVRALEDTGTRLRYDDDLTLLAFSKDKQAIQFYSGGDDFEYMVSFTGRLRKRIGDYDTFNDVFFANILGPTKNNPNCFLSLLNQGPDAMKYHSDLIASYLGLADEEELHMLHAASNNLLHWGF
jgi:hypothetical protein